MRGDSADMGASGIPAECGDGALLKLPMRGEGELGLKPYGLYGAGCGTSLQLLTCHQMGICRREKQHSLRELHVIITIRSHIGVTSSWRRRPIRGREDIVWS